MLVFKDDDFETLVILEGKFWVWIGKALQRYIWRLHQAQNRLRGQKNWRDCPCNVCSKPVDAPPCEWDSFTPAQCAFCEDEHHCPLAYTPRVRDNSQDWMEIDGQRS